MEMEIEIENRHETKHESVTGQRVARVKILILFLIVRVVRTRNVRRTCSTRRAIAAIAQFLKADLKKFRIILWACDL